MGTLQGKIHFSLGLNIQFSMMSTISAECCPEFLPILQTFLGITLVSFGYQKEKREHVEAISIVER